MKWIAVETHTHTVHSDAKFTVAELLEAAHQAQLDAIVISDHNTDTALEEVPANQREPMVIPGIEWTSFYGHVVLIGPERFVEFRDLTTKNLDEHLRAAHEAGAVAVMAHPCCLGEPFCCGCHWDFEVPDWKEMDALEVWSEDNPSLNPRNGCAYKLWNRKLAEGFTPTALSARDWHRNFAADIPFGVNYMQVEEGISVTEAVKNAIRAGRSYFSLGPTVDVRVLSGGRQAGIGAHIQSGKGKIQITFGDQVRKEVWEPYEIIPETIVVRVNSREKKYEFAGFGRQLCVEEELDKGSIRIELYGKIHGSEGAILITNPIFVDENVSIS